MYHPALAYPTRRPRMAEPMVADWRYLGAVLRGEGEQMWEAYMAARLAFVDETSRGVG